MKPIKSLSALAVVVLAIMATSCKGRTINNVEPTGDTVEVVISESSEAADSMNHDAEAVTLPDSIEVPE